MVGVGVVVPPIVHCECFSGSKGPMWYCINALTPVWLAWVWWSLLLCTANVPANAESKGPMWYCINAAQTRLYCCTLHSTELVTFSVDQATGALAELGRIAYPKAPAQDPHGR